jgi:hypothetical protein
MVGDCSFRGNSGEQGIGEPGAVALADRYWRENRYQQALVHYREAVAQAPKAANYRVRLAQCACG